MVLIIFTALRLSLFVLFPWWVSALSRTINTAASSNSCKNSKNPPTFVVPRTRHRLYTKSSDDKYTAIEMPSQTEEKDPTIRVLGICGGIGSGKSMACKLLVSDLGCLSHIEADSIAHSVYQPGSQAVRDVVTCFGPDILIPGTKEGLEEVDRKKLGSIVFDNPEAMSKLEQIVWPHVKTKIFSRIEEIKKQDVTKESLDNETMVPVIVVEAAVLLDAGWEDALDGVWVVRAPPTVAVERLVEHRSFSVKDAKQRIEAQNSRRGIGNIDEEVKRGIVTAIIENTGGLEELKESLQKALHDENAWKQ